MILENIDYSKCIIIGVNTVDSEFNTDKLRLVSDVYILNLVTGNAEMKNYSDCVKMVGISLLIQVLGLDICIKVI